MARRTITYTKAELLALKPDQYGFDNNATDEPGTDEEIGLLLGGFDPTGRVRTLPTYAGATNVSEIYSVDVTYNVVSNPSTPGNYGVLGIFFLTGQWGGGGGFHTISSFTTTGSVDSFYYESGGDAGIYLGATDTFSTPTGFTEAHGDVTVSIVPDSLASLFSGGHPFSAFISVDAQTVDSGWIAQYSDGYEVELVSISADIESDLLTDYRSNTITVNETIESDVTDIEDVTLKSWTIGELLGDDAGEAVAVRGITYNVELTTDPGDSSTCGLVQFVLGNSHPSDSASYICYDLASWYVRDSSEEWIDSVLDTNYLDSTPEYWLVTVGVDNVPGEVLPITNPGITSSTGPIEFFTEVFDWDAEQIASRTDTTAVAVLALAVDDTTGNRVGTPTYEFTIQSFTIYYELATAEPEPTPIPGTIDFPKLVGWHFYIDDRALIGGHAPELKLDYLLTRAENKSVTFDLYEPHQCSFTIDGKHPEASLVNELIHDVVAAREGEILFRGRIGSSSDSIDSDVHTVTFTANSYKAMLDRRVLHDTYDTTSGAVEQEEIAWEAIETSQNHIAGDLGITRGSDQQTGVLRADEWDIGTYIGEMIDDMSSRQYGFDWEIDEYLVFRVWPSFRGTNKGFPLEYGGTAVSVDRVFDASAFANWVWTQGTVASTSTWRGQYMSGLSSRPEGLWEMTQSAPDSRTADELTAIAAGELAKASSAVPAYTFTLRQGDWTGPDDFWLGDTVPVIIRTGRLNVVENYRVFRMVFNIDPNGLEELVVTAGSPELSLVQRLWKYGRRITNLENR